MTERLAEEWTPTQAEFGRFAALSGDDNPIHVDAAFVGRTRFGRTVAHGMLLYARVWSLVRRAWPDEAHAAQGLMFPNPAFAGEELRLEIERHGSVVEAKIRRIADQELTLVGECRLGAAPSPRAADATGGFRMSDDGAANVLLVGGAASVTRTFGAPEATALSALVPVTPGETAVPQPLIGALFSYLLGMKLPGAGTNYLKQEMEFLAPAPYGQPLEASVEITRLRPEKHLVDLATTCHLPDGTEICRGRALVLVRDVA